MSSIPGDVDGNAHVVMVPTYITYMPGPKTYQVIEETEEHYIIEVQIGDEKKKTVVDKSICSVASITMTGDIR